MSGKITILFAIVVAALASGALAQEGTDPELIQKLLDRIERLEARVRELEATRPEPPPPAQPGPAPAAPATPAPAGGEPEPLINVDAPLVDRLSIGGSVRVRGETRHPADYRIPGTFGRAAGDDEDDSADFVEQRIRLHLDADVNEHLRAFVELQDSRTWGEEASLVADTADFDLKQGFLEIRKIFDEPLSVQAGRIELPRLGDQRLVSDLDWHNVGRSFDAVMGKYRPQDWDVTAFSSILREGRAFAADVDDDDFVFNGIYVSYRGVEKHEFDVYAFNRYLSDDVFRSEERGRFGDRWDVTPGARVKGAYGRFGWTAELAGQFGDQAGDPVRAWAAVATAGYSFDAAWKPWAGVEYAFASGDGDPTDGVVETFDPLFPFGHAYHGHMDLVGWRNLQALKGMFRIEPLEKWTIHLDFHSFWLTEDQDAWYGAAGTAVRRDPTGRAGNHLGYELDVYTKWVLWDRLHFWVGYSHFFASDFVEDTGSHQDMDWAFLQAELKF